MARPRSLKVNIDLIPLAARIEVIANHLEPYRERLVAELRVFELSAIDDLVSLGWAAASLSLDIATCAPAPRVAAALIKRASVCRARLAAALRFHQAFAKGPLRHRVPTLSRRLPVHHAVVLEGLLHGLAGVGALDSPSLAEEVATAHQLIHDLSRVPPGRPKSDELEELKLLRARAWVLLQARYEEVRAAVLYVGRNNPRITQLVPGVWKMRGPLSGKRRKKAKAKAEPAPA